MTTSPRGRDRSLVSDEIARPSRPARREARFRVHVDPAGDGSQEGLRDRRPDPPRVPSPRFDLTSYSSRVRSQRRPKAPKAT